MLINIAKPSDLRESDVTPESIYKGTNSTVHLIIRNPTPRHQKANQIK
ncbi:hypothetical protein [Halomonas eurihalina]|nr:hypothetical protein [Halomonas eurihalina]MDR5860701.1 hypothetical protein [Halomonas eurihalina]